MARVCQAPAIPQFVPFPRTDTCCLKVKFPFCRAYKPGWQKAWHCWVIMFHRCTTSRIGKSKGQFLRLHPVNCCPVCLRTAPASPSGTAVTEQMVLMSVSFYKVVSQSPSRVLPIEPGWSKEQGQHRKGSRAGRLRQTLDPAMPKAQISQFYNQWHGPCCLS